MPFHLIAGRQHCGRIQTGHSLSHNQILELGLTFHSSFFLRLRLGLDLDLCWFLCLFTAGLRFIVFTARRGFRWNSNGTFGGLGFWLGFRFVRFGWFLGRSDCRALGKWLLLLFGLVGFVLVKAELLIIII